MQLFRNVFEKKLFNDSEKYLCYNIERVGLKQYIQFIPLLK